MTRCIACFYSIHFSFGEYKTDCYFPVFSPLAVIEFTLFNTDSSGVVCKCSLSSLGVAIFPVGM